MRSLSSALLLFRLKQVCVLAPQQSELAPTPICQVVVTISKNALRNRMSGVYLSRYINLDLSLVRDRNLASDRNRNPASDLAITSDLVLARYVTRAVREEIEDTLLLPIAEIERRKREKS